MQPVGRGGVRAHRSQYSALPPRPEVQKPLLKCYHVQHLLYASTCCFRALWRHLNTALYVTLHNCRFWRILISGGFHIFPYFIEVHRYQWVENSQKITVVLGKVEKNLRCCTKSDTKITLGKKRKEKQKQKKEKQNGGLIYRHLKPNTHVRNETSKIPREGLNSFVSLSLRAVF